MMRKRVSGNLFAENDQICCASCKKSLASTSENWKGRVALSVIPVAELPGIGRNVESRVVLRQFSCPHCGRLLDTETALPEDPYLEDLVKV
jgi:acetone carboxylase gamma subunit